MRCKLTSQTLFLIVSLVGIATRVPLPPCFFMHDRVVLFNFRNRIGTTKSLLEKVVIGNQLTRVMFEIS